MLMMGTLILLLNIIWLNWCRSLLLNRVQATSRHACSALRKRPLPARCFFARRKSRDDSDNDRQSIINLYDEVIGSDQDGTGWWEKTSGSLATTVGMERSLLPPTSDAERREALAATKAALEAASKSLDALETQQYIPSVGLESLVVTLGDMRPLLYSDYLAAFKLFPELKDAAERQKWPDSIHRGRTSNISRNNSNKDSLNAALNCEMNWTPEDAEVQATKLRQDIENMKMINNAQDKAAALFTSESSDRSALVTRLSRFLHACANAESKFTRESNNNDDDDDDDDNNNNNNNNDNNNNTGTYNASLLSIARTLLLEAGVHVFEPTVAMNSTCSTDTDSKVTCSDKTAMATGNISTSSRKSTTVTGCDRITRSSSSSSSSSSILDDQFEVMDLFSVGNTGTPTTSSGGSGDGGEAGLGTTVVRAIRLQALWQQVIESPLFVDPAAATPHTSAASTTVAPQEKYEVDEEEEEEEEEEQQQQQQQHYDGVGGVGGGEAPDPHRQTWLWLLGHRDRVREMQELLLSVMRIYLRTVVLPVEPMRSRSSFKSIAASASGLTTTTTSGTTTGTSDGCDGDDDDDDNDDVHDDVHDDSDDSGGGLAKDELLLFLYPNEQNYPISTGSNEVLKQFIPTELSVKLVLTAEFSHIMAVNNLILPSHKPNNRRNIEEIQEEEEEEEEGFVESVVDIGFIVSKPQW